MFFKGLTEFKVDTFYVISLYWSIGQPNVTSKIYNNV